jgi:CHASE2 domain-containing sensor protein
MVTLLVSTFLGIRLGIEDLFVRDVKGAVAGWFPGRPSVLTMIEFILIALAGILAMLNLRNLNLKLLCLGWMIMITGGLAVVGYLFNVPFLRYDIKGWSNPMAIHTSILFTMIGIGLILLGKTTKKE